MTIEKTKVLISGGFGALGFNLTQALQRMDSYDVHIVDDLSAGVANFSKNVAFTHLDIGNSEKVGAFFKAYRPNLVFHLAAHFANQNSVDHPISDVSTNIVGLINVLESQRENPTLRKVVYTSSSCVYGNLTEMKEAASVGPHDTPYAINKYAAELYCRYYSEIQGLPTACARVFNSYGPGEMPGQYRNVIPNFILKALNDEEIIITGTGEETRDFTYVSDTVDLLLRLGESEYRNGEVFNGGTGVKTSIAYLAETIVRMAGSDSKISFSSPRNWDHVKDRCSDITRSRELLGYAPTVDLEHGLVETIEWIRSKLQRREAVAT